MTSPQDIEACAQRLGRACERWRALPLEGRLQRLLRWAAWWVEGDPRIIPHLESMAQESGLSQPMVTWGARDTALAWEAGARALVLDALGQDALALDEGRARALPLHGHIWASTLPTSGWIPVLGSLALGAAVILRAPQGAQRAAWALHETLAQVSLEAAGCLEIASWDSGGPQEEALAERCDALCLSGGAQATARYASLIAAQAPRHVAWLPFGPGYSVAVAPSGTWEGDRALARALALDVAAYDQRGCLSPQALWLEGDDQEAGAAFCALLAQALGELEDTLPRGQVPTEALAARVQRRGTAQFLGQAFEERTGLVLWEPTPHQVGSPLYRTLPVHLYQGGPQGLAARLPALRLQSAALAGGLEQRRLYAPALGALGANRLCEPGQMQTPPATWHHDGLPWLSQLVQFIDWR